MVEFVPFLLIILGWHPDTPQDIDLERPEMLFESVEACRDAGAKLAKEMTAAAREKGGEVYEFHCLRAPSGREFDEAFKQIKKRGS